MQREIGLIGLTFVAVSGMIGSGWLFAPLLASQLAGPAALVSWGIGGIAMLLLALTFAEISAMLPVPGGIARVPQFSHGNVVSMAMGWSAWVGYLTTAPIEVEAMLKYLAPHAGWLYTGTGADKVLSIEGIAISSGFLLLFTFINAVGVRFFAYVNTTITWAKIVIPMVVLVALIASRFESTNLEAGGGFAPFGLEGILAAVSSGGVIFAFIGFRHAIDLSGEAHRPHVTVPLALILSLIICLVVYGGIQLAFLGALDPAEIANGWNKINLGHEYGPLGALAAAVGILWLISLLNIASVVSPFGGGLVAVGSNARLAMAIAQNGLFPRIIAAVSRQGVPLNALILNWVISILAFTLLPFSEIVALNGSAIILSFVVGPIAVVALRELLPDRVRPFKVPLIGVIAPLAFIISTLVIYWSGWDTVWRLGICLVFGLVILLIRVQQTRGQNMDLREAQWLIPYLLGICAVSYLGDFGGGVSVLPFGWDMLVCAVFGYFIYVYAVRCHLPPEKFQHYLDEAKEHLDESEYSLTGAERAPAE